MRMYFLIKPGCLLSQRYNFLKAIHNKYCKSICYIVSRNGLEPLCTKEVLFLLLQRVSLLFFSIDFNFKKQKTVSYSFLKRFSSEGFRFSNVSCDSKSTKNPALSGGIQLIENRIDIISTSIQNKCRLIAEQRAQCDRTRFGNSASL